jgi:ParB family chromosome partitioning protein
VPEELTAEQNRLQAKLDEFWESEEEPPKYGDDRYNYQAGLQEQLEAVEARIAEFVAFDPKKMKSAGCYVYIGHDGTLVVERGLVRKKDEQKAAKGKKGMATEAPDISDALRRDLEAYRLQVAQAEISSEPSIAFDLLVFKLATQVLGTRESFDGPDVRLTVQPGSDEESQAAKALATNWRHLPKEWMASGSEAEKFGAFRVLADDDKRKILAFCVAKSLLPSLAPTAEDKQTAPPPPLRDTCARVCDYWRPTKANYLGRISREQLLAIGEEVFGPEWVKPRKNDKKGKLADALDAAFASPEAHGTTHEQVEKLKTWLPAGMSFSPFFEPKRVKPKKGKQAA